MSVENAVLPVTSADVAELGAREAVKAPESTSQVNVAEAEAAAREPLKQPENGSTQAAALREPPPKPEQSTLNAAPAAVTPAVAAVIPMHSSNVVTKEAFVKAEQNLAAHLANTLDPALVQGMQLTLSNALSDSADGRIGGTDLKLCFTGSQIEANFAELSRELVKTLAEHPMLKSLLAGNKTLVIEQADSPQKGQMLHLHLPNLTAEQYSTLINTLASGSPAVAPKVKVHADEPVNAAAGLADSPTTPAAPVIQEPTIQQPVIKPAKTADEAPAAKVEAPVVKMETLKEAELGRTA